MAREDPCGRVSVRARRRPLLALLGLAATAGAALPFLEHSNFLGLALANASNEEKESPEPPKEDSVAMAKQALLEADAVFFDVDSTVVKTEGINLLGKCFGVMKQISELTTKAMEGNVKFQDAMADRLQLLADNGMTQQTLEKCIKTEGRPRWSPGIQQLVRRLQVMGKDVYLVSGGFFNMIQPLAEVLNIPDEMVYANTILFNKDGSYRGFDKSAPTSRSGGKPKVLQEVQRKKGYKIMVMFGDGATDADAKTKGPAKAFIGYGGVAVREKVKKSADWFVYGFKEVIAILPKVDV